MSKFRLIKITIRWLTPRFYHIKSFFIKDKNRLGTSLPTLFSTRWFFLNVYFINRTNFIAWLSFLLHVMLGTMCIPIICLPICDVINFTINHSFLIKAFLDITKWLSPDRRNFKHEIKFFIFFKGLSVVRDSRRPLCGPSNINCMLTFL